MKKILLLLSLAVSVTLYSYSQCSNPNTGQDTAFCGLTAELSVENSTTGYWTAYFNDIELNPAPIYSPSNTSTSIEVTIDAIDGFTQIIEFVWTDDSGPCNDTVLVEFVEQPIANVGDDFDVCGGSASISGGGDAMLTSWLPYPGCIFDDYYASQTIVYVSSYGAKNFSWSITNDSNITSTSCNDTDEVIVTFWPDPMAFILTDYSDTIFNCGTVYYGLQSEGTGIYSTGAWVADNVFSLVGGPSGSNPVVDIMVSDFGLVNFYWVEQSGPTSINCQDSAGPVSIYFANEQTPFAGYDDEVFSSEYELSAEFTGPQNSIFPITYLWANSSASFDNPNEPLTNVSVPDYGEYEFTFSASYVGYPECSGSDTVNVNFLDPFFQWASDVDSDIDDFSSPSYSTQQYETIKNRKESNSIIDINQKFTLDIYPNPTSSILNIKSDLQIWDISVTDLNGRIVLSPSSQQANIDINSLETGVYFLKVSTPNGVFNKKFIKQ